MDGNTKNYEVDTQEWVDIPGYENKYQASRYGEILSLNYLHTGLPKVLTPDKTQKGYLRVALWNGNVKTRFLVHRLIALTFLGENNLQVNHKNGIKSDNRLSNLEYCTPSENTLHKYRVLGEHHHGPCGEKSHWSILKDEDVISIRNLHSSGQYSYVALAKLFGVHKQTIAGIVQRNKWKHI